MMTDDREESNYCSFCGNHKDAVEALIVADGANICNECVETCEQVLEDGGFRSTMRKGLTEGEFKPSSKRTIYNLLNESQIIHYLVTRKADFRWSFGFMLRGPFEEYESVIHSHNNFDELYIGLNILREELQLDPANNVPGDIDVLILPAKGGQNFYDKTMVIEAKVVRPTVHKPSRNANRLGIAQTLGLIKDGFPYVGLMHVVIPEALPRHLLDTIEVSQLGKKTPEEEEALGQRKTVKMDMFSIQASNRQFGRLNSAGLPDYVGILSLGIKIRTKNEGDNVYWGIASYTTANETPPKVNPNTNLQTIEKVKAHFEANRNRYLNMPWADAT